MGCFKVIWIICCCIFFSLGFAIGSANLFGDFSFKDPFTFGSILGAIAGLVFGYIFARYLFKNPLEFLIHID